VTRKEEDMSSREQYTPGATLAPRSRKKGEEWTLGPRPRAPPPACQGLAGAHRPRATPRVGAVRFRPEPRCGRHSEAHDRSGAPKLHCHRDPGEAGRSPPRRSSTTGAEATCAGSWSRSEAAARSSPSGPIINKAYISMGASGWHVCFDVLDSAALGSAHWPHRRTRGHAGQGLAGVARRVLEEAGRRAPPLVTPRCEDWKEGWT
jgi:hypothetical protein